MTLFDDWARDWAVHPAAVADLRKRLLLLDGDPAMAVAGESEASVQARVRMEASRYGLRLWRNNVGAVHDGAKGVHIRYGLANDSPAVNARIKSADLIGIRPRLIGPEDMGRLIGQFVSVEVKHGGWKYTGTEHEQAQANWKNLVLSLGGDARFVTGTGQI